MSTVLEKQKIITALNAENQLLRKDLELARASAKIAQHQAEGLKKAIDHVSDMSVLLVADAISGVDEQRARAERAEAERDTYREKSFRLSEKACLTANALKKAQEALRRYHIRSGSDEDARFRAKALDAVDAVLQNPEVA